MSIYSDLKEALMLLESVKALQTATKEVAEMVNNIDRRLIRLEERFDGHAENVKVAASSAAASAAHSASNGLRDRIESIEKRIGTAERDTPMLPARKK